ncbi:hypothetical protein [Actinobacillus equuli]|uniref:hypothetical protein n=1 Tax=Actinobacillus equuli TaxID=718 RepID=UPI0024412693|nr:hypothetical protein [Actinobacillus equuli]WGE43095.1 hypothetical protein NYR64_04435 [Actinobacillus equuli subsp. haemolyticus]
MSIFTYSPDVIARNVKQLGNGVIEVRRYNDGHIRADLSWVWFLGVMGVTIYDYFTTQSMFKEILWVVDPMGSIEDIFHFYEDPNNIGYTRAGSSFNEFAEGMLRRHSSSFYWGWFYILFPLFWFFMVISPKWRPVRFDSKHRLVYFWSWGRLYIMHYPKAVQRDREQLRNFLNPEMFAPWIRPQHFGSLVFTLPQADNPKRTRRLPLGIYRPACEYQNHALLEFILDYLGSENPDEEYGKFFKKEKRITSDYFNWFYQFSLFPAWGYNEKKTEAKIQAWLEKQQ